MVLVYTAFFYPLEMAFYWVDKIPKAHSRLNSFADIVFLADIFVSFMTSYTRDDINLVVRDPKKIA